MPIVATRNNTISLSRTERNREGGEQNECPPLIVCPVLDALAFYSRYCGLSHFASLELDTSIHTQQVNMVVPRAVLCFRCFPCSSAPVNLLLYEPYASDEYTCCLLIGYICLNGTKALSRVNMLSSVLSVVH